MKERRKAEQLAAALAMSCRSQLQKARLWLVLFLTECPAHATYVIRTGARFGFSETTIRRASQGIVKKTHVGSFGGVWRWELLEPMQTVGVNAFQEWTTALLLKLL